MEAENISQIRVMTRKAGHCALFHKMSDTPPTSTTTDPEKGRTTTTQQPELPQPREQHQKPLSGGYTTIQFLFKSPHLHTFPLALKVRNLEIISSASRTTCIQLSNRGRGLSPSDAQRDIEKLPHQTQAGCGFKKGESLFPTQSNSQQTTTVFGLVVIHVNIPARQPPRHLSQPISPGL